MSDFLFANDTAIFLVLGLLAAGVLIAAGRKPVDRERLVVVLLATFLFFSGTLRFALLFVEDAFLSGAVTDAAGLAAGEGDVLTRLGLAELGIAVLCLFGLRASLSSRSAATVPLSIVLIGGGLAWFVSGTGTGTFEAIAGLVAGGFGLVLLAFDWAHRGAAPDPLQPDSQRFTY